MLVMDAEVRPARYRGSRRVRCSCRLGLRGVSSAQL